MGIYAVDEYSENMKYMEYLISIGFALIRDT